MKYSGIVHTYNEESNITECLESLKWCDEIIIIDMHSTDRTVELARNYTDKIFYHDFEDYADPAREFGLSKTTGDWIMVLDADERLPKELVGKLKNIAENEEVEIVYIPWKNIIFNKWIKHTQWWPDYHPRFFKKGFLSYSNNIHNFEKVSGRIKYLAATEENAVIHYNYKSIKHFKQKTDRYTTIEAKKLNYIGVRSNYIKMLFYGFKEFIWRYFLGKGFLDGKYGLLLSYLMFRYKFITYWKLWKIQKEK